MIQLSSLCDSRFDCQDQSDESMCFAYYHSRVLHIASPAYDEKIPESCKMNHRTPCNYIHSECFDTNKLCIYERHLNAEPLHCPNTEHLQNCYHHQCHSEFKCPNSFCIPFHMVCDEINDCDNGEDEMSCHPLACPGLMKCRYDNVCVHPLQWCDGKVDCLSSMDDEMFCDQPRCPSECVCHGYAMYCRRVDDMIVNYLTHQCKAVILRGPQLNLKHLSRGKYLLYIDISQSNISIYQLKRFQLPVDNLLLYLNLSMNRLSTIDSYAFKSLRYVTRIDLSHNPIFNIQSYGFSGLLTLRYLNLSSLRILYLGACSFCGMTHLISLDISFNNITSIIPGTFNDVDDTLTYINMKYNGISTASTSVFIGLRKDIVFIGQSELCCFLRHSANGCQYQIDKCHRLFRDSIPLMAWSVTFLSLMLNIAVILYRSRSYTHTSHDLLVQLLACVDIMCCFYLLSLLYSHHTYGDKFILNITQWTYSLTCVACRLFASVSFSMTRYITLIIVINQMIQTKYALKLKKINRLTTILLAMAGLLVAIAQAVSLERFTENHDSMLCSPFTVSINLTYILRVWLLSLFFVVTLICQFVIMLCSVAIIKHVIVSSKKVQINRKEIVDILILRTVLFTLTMTIQWVAMLLCFVLSVQNVSLSHSEPYIMVFALNMISLQNPLFHTFCCNSFVTRVRKKQVSQRVTQGH